MLLRDGVFTRKHKHGAFLKAYSDVAFTWRRFRRKARNEGHIQPFNRQFQKVKLSEKLP